MPTAIPAAKGIVLLRHALAAGRGAKSECAFRIDPEYRAVPAPESPPSDRSPATLFQVDRNPVVWTDSAQPAGRGRPRHETDMAITTLLMMKRVLHLSRRYLPSPVDSICTLMALLLCCPDYSGISQRTKAVHISFTTPTRGEISHRVIDATGLKVLWKVRQHGADRHRMWRRLHLAADRATHEIICTGLSLCATAVCRYCRDCLTC
ncbi:hypothetical protein F8538_08395 [Edwardsiella ictaluri]|nr:hypothetical protein F8538_08395 [Edwardsiella ictaluri]